MPCYLDKIGNNLHGDCLGSPLSQRSVSVSDQLIFSCTERSPVFIFELWQEKNLLERNTMELVKLKIATEATIKSCFERASEKE